MRAVVARRRVQKRRRRRVQHVERRAAARDAAHEDAAHEQRIVASEGLGVLDVGVPERHAEARVGPERAPAALLNLRAQRRAPRVVDGLPGLARRGEARRGADVLLRHERAVVEQAREHVARQEVVGRGRGQHAVRGGVAVAFRSSVLCLLRTLRRI